MSLVMPDDRAHGHFNLFQAFSRIVHRQSWYLVVTMSERQCDVLSRLPAESRLRVVVDFLDTKPASRPLTTELSFSEVDERYFDSLLGA